MARAVYHGFGLTIASDFSICGALAEDNDAAPDIVVVQHDRDDPGSGETWRREGAALVYAWPGCGTFRCSAERIEVSPCAGVAPDILGELLIANALPAAL